MWLRVCSEATLLLAFTPLLAAGSTFGPTQVAELSCDNGVDDELSLLQTLPGLNWSPDRYSRSKKLPIEADEPPAWQSQNLLVQDGAAAAEATNYQSAGLQKQVQQLEGDANTGYVERRDMQLGLVDVMSSEASLDSQAASEWLVLQNMVKDMQGRSIGKAGQLQSALVDAQQARQAEKKAKRSEHEAWTLARQAQNELHKALEVEADKLQLQRKKVMEVQEVKRAASAEVEADKLQLQRKEVMEVQEVKRAASAELREASIQLQREHEDMASLVKWANTMQQNADAKVKWARHAQTQAAQQLNWATAAQKEAAGAADAMDQVAQAQLKMQGLS